MPETLEVGWRGPYMAGSFFPLQLLVSSHSLCIPFPSMAQHADNYTDIINLYIVSNDNGSVRWIYVSVLVLQRCLCGPATVKRPGSWWIGQIKKLVRVLQLMNYCSKCPSLRPTALRPTNMSRYYHVTILWVRAGDLLLWGGEILFVIRDGMDDVIFATGGILLLLNCQHNARTQSAPHPPYQKTENC